MREIEEYMDRIMFEAALVPRDEQRVRQELEEHLHEIVELRDGSTLTTEDVMMKLEKEFGDPEELGKAIARAKGKFRTFLKKELRKAPRDIVIAVVIAFALKAAVVQAFVAKGNQLPSGLEVGNYVLVNKLASHYEPNDIVVCKIDGKPYFYEVAAADDEDGRITLAKADELLVVEEDSIIGKVILQTR